MADSGDSAGSWPGLLAQLNKTFDLLRDLFGYAVPGVVFFAICIATGRLSLAAVHSKLAPYEPPTWALVGLAGAGCYAMGHILAMLAYLPLEIAKLFYRSHPEKLKAFPTEVTKELLVIRQRHGELFLAADRRETMAILMGGLGMALLIGGLFACYGERVSLCQLFVATGVLLVFDFFTALLHLTRVRHAIVDADHEIENPSHRV